MMSLEFVEPDNQAAALKVIGVGGCGGNAVQYMLDNNIGGVEYISANTDLQALKNSTAQILQLGKNTTRGLGAGSDPEVGRTAAEEDLDCIRDALEGTDMVFITAGMGGGTGTGAVPVVAQAAREMKILTVAIVTRPLSIEGKHRVSVANEGIKKLSQYVDSLIIIPNDKLVTVLGSDMSMLKAFGAANDILLGAVQGIAELITRPGLINVDFADVRTVMSEMGMAMMGSAVAHGEERAKTAAVAAISSPLLEDVDLSGAKGMLVNITTSENINIGELQAVGHEVTKDASDKVRFKMGTVIDNELGEEMRVTVVATGLRQTEADDDSKRVKLIEDVPADGYKQLDRPAVMRKNQDSDIQNTEDDLAYLDIPAFLRRQAD